MGRNVLVKTIDGVELRLNSRLFRTPAFRDVSIAAHNSRLSLPCPVEEHIAATAKLHCARSCIPGPSLAS